MNFIQTKTILQQILKTFFVLLLICIATSSHAAQKIFPVPDTVSPEIQTLIEASPFPLWNSHPQNTTEWNKFVQSVDEGSKDMLPDLLKRMQVNISQKTIANVPVYIITPENLPASNADSVLLNFHGGGYVLGAGEAGLTEAVYMAGIGKFKVLMPDYRLAPKHPYPAALDDAMTVYKELIKSTPPDKIGVFGTSTGGGLTLALTLRAKAEGLPLPAALAAGTPWTDLTKTGDSYFVNEGVDNVLVSYDGWLGEAAKVYAAGHNLKDPMLSPIYGNVSNFPPTMLISGTRDLFLSNTVRMHTKLRMANVKADLIVLEGLSHAQYHMLPNAPETQFHFEEVGKFFRNHLSEKK